MAEAFITRRGGGSSSNGGMYAWKKVDSKSEYVAVVTTSNKEAGSSMSTKDFGSEYTINKTTGELSLAGTIVSANYNTANQYKGYYYFHGGILYRLNRNSGYYLYADQTITSTLSTNNNFLGYVLDNDPTKYPNEGVGSDGNNYLGVEKLHWAKGNVTVMGNYTDYTGSVVDLAFRPKMVFLTCGSADPTSIVAHDSYDTSLGVVDGEGLYDIYVTTNVSVTFLDNGFTINKMKLDDYYAGSASYPTLTVYYIAWG